MNINQISQVYPLNTMPGGWKDSAQAFDEALASGRLSLDENAHNFVGLYMYMGPGLGGDAFKHIYTRQYLG